MTAHEQVVLHELPGWLIKACRLIATWQGFVATNLVGLIINLLATWLTSTSAMTSPATLLGVLLAQWWVLVAIQVGSWLVFGLSAIVGRLPEIKKPHTQIREEYLTRVIALREKLEIEGIPTPLIYDAVELEAIFIQPRFKSYRALADQVLTQEMSKRLRAGMRSGEVAPEVEAVLIERARAYEQLLGQDKSVTITELWELLSREEPAAVIQGTPGMGKSTFLMRLALYMARRGLGKRDDLRQRIEPTLVPLFISLGLYATFRQQHQKLDEKEKSIWAYLQTRPREMIELSSAETVAWLKQELANGHCLVLLDALDEVSASGERREVQEAIQAFVTEVRSQTDESGHYNRFLITSRIAGYDPHAFRYLHYTLAELTQEQISDFLPRWCRASTRRKLGRAGLNEEMIQQQAKEIEQDLSSALNDHQGIKEMAENPFLLTLLALLRQNNYALPHRRIELYQKVSEILLIHRNERRNLPGIPENQALKRLGPLAYQMQANKNSFVTRNEARAAIIEVLVQEEKMPADLAPKAADDFLQRVRERGGIFVFRAGDFLGFFHRTFQEYFAARHLLNLLAADPVRIRQELLEKGRRQDALWREPFLLALAYKNGEPSSDAQELMRVLLAGLPIDGRKQRAHDVLLVGQCLIEAKSSVIPHDLEQQVVRILLEIYALALEKNDTQTCQNGERVMTNILRGISEEAEHSAALQILYETLRKSSSAVSQKVSPQLALLILLTMIGPQLGRCKNLIFRQLVPLLLGLADQPELGNFAPEVPDAQPTLEINDWALTALQALEAQGPAGEALREEGKSFEPYLEQLACISLERGLLTPVLLSMPPKDHGQGVRNWQDLQDRRRRQRKERMLAEAISIQRELLQTAEMLCYPMYRYLLALLVRSQDQANWQQIWQTYLLKQMESGSSQDYQQCALLWLMLFPEFKDQQTLATHLKMDLFSASPRHRFAQHFVLKMVRYLRNLVYSGDLRDLRDLRDFIYLRHIRELMYFLNTRNLRYLRDLRDLYQEDYVENANYLSDLSKILFEPSLTKEIEQRLAQVPDEERVELLLLLQGRFLQIQIEEEMNVEQEEEIKGIVKASLTWSKGNQEATEVMYTLLRLLPARVKGEIILLVKLAREAQDVHQQTACAVALRRARPRDDQAWAVLEMAQTSGVAEIEKVARERLKKR